jgi:hypothetical protein
LQQPHDHVAELLRLLKRALAGRVGHLGPSEQRLMQMPYNAWPGAHKASRLDAVEVALRFIRWEMTAAEMTRVVRNALLIVRIAQEHEATVERLRLAIARNEPLPYLARPVEDFKDPWKEIWPEWWEFEAPGPYNAPW